MNTTQDRRRVRRTWLRSGLLVVAATPLAGGLWALLFPRAFYDDFPLPGSGWVSTLGPYNEHLVRDYGALNLAMAVLLLAVGVLLERRLMQVALLSWLVFEVPHFIFHVGQTHHFPREATWRNWAVWACSYCFPLSCSSSRHRKARGVISRTQKSIGRKGYRPDEQGENWPEAQEQDLL